MIEARIGKLGDAMKYNYGEGVMEEVTIKQQASDIRKDVDSLKIKVAALHNHPVFAGEDMRLSPGNCPESQQANMHANITLAFRHLEDARMRLGKVIQAATGGVSCYDKK